MSRRAAAASAKTASGRPSPVAIAGWNGAPFTNVRYCFTASTLVTSGAGAVSQPIFQPVVLNVLPPDEIEIVRSRAPGSVAIGVCGTSNVRCSYTSSVTMIASWRSASRTIRASVSVSSTAPVGLCGEFTRMIRVRSPTAASSSSGSGRQSGKRSGTVRCTPPARAISAA